MRCINLVSAAAILLASSGIAHAYQYRVINRTDKPVWVSAYDATGGHNFTRCVLAGNSVSQRAKQREIVYVRGELKDSRTTCNGKTLSDTGKGPPISVGNDTVKFFEAYKDKLYLR